MSMSSLQQKRWDAPNPNVNQIPPTPEMSKAQGEKSIGSAIPPQKDVMAMGREELKAHVRSYLNNANVLDESQLPVGMMGAGSDEVLKHLEAKGMLDSLYQSVETSMKISDKGVAPPQATGSSEMERLLDISPGEPMKLTVTIRDARAFVDFVSPEDCRDRELQLHASFMSQRWKGKPCTATVDPDLSDSFTLNLPVPARAAPSSLIDLEVPLVLIVTARNHPPSGDVEVVSCHHVEWRDVLWKGRVDDSYELKGVGKKHRLGVGALHCSVELWPPRSAPGLPALLTKKDVDDQLKGEIHRRTESSRVAFDICDRWLSRYRQGHEEFQQRHTPLFGETERRECLPVTSFIVPLKGGRTIESPMHAARYVSMIPQAPNAVHHEIPCWNSLPVILSRKQASIEEHAILLCCLLRGFGLDAWVCLGTRNNGQRHAWVLTRDRAVEGTFWESLTGKRHLPSDGAYAELHFVFNDREAYASTITDGSMEVTFSFESLKRWYQLTPEVPALPLKLYTLDQSGCAEFRMRPPSRSPIQLQELEETVEARLREDTDGYRAAIGLPRAQWDEHLSHVLTMSLSNYEIDRTVGTSYGTPLFQQAIRHICSRGDLSFQAYPVQFLHADCQHYFSTLVGAPACKRIIECPASSAPVFGVTCRAVQYPEDVMAIWVIIAVKHK